MGKGTVRAKIAGTMHKGARSFTAASVAAFEKTRAYRDLSVAWLVPTRGWYPCEVVGSWDQIVWSMNQFRSGRLEAVGLEVAAAYELLVNLATNKKANAKAFEGQSEYGKAVLKTKWIFTAEEDNIIPPYAVQELLAAIFTCPDCGIEIGRCCADKKRECKNCREWRCERGHKGYDGISGLYSVKSDPPIPMAFGDPKNPGDFKPRSVARAMKSGKVLEVNGIAMGCAIFRKALFKSVKRPWFKTSHTHTQDLYFCKKAKKEAGARFGVHCGVLVGHLNVSTREVV